VLLGMYSPTVPDKGPWLTNLCPSGDWSGWDVRSVGNGFSIGGGGEDVPKNKQ
jgi:hypothetical protein